MSLPFSDVQAAHGSGFSGPDPEFAGTRADLRGPSVAQKLEPKGKLPCKHYG
jgi:hypothetical protein